MSAADSPDQTGPPEVGASAVNADSPWLGLASFTEATRGYFYGREQEITELERRVQRKLLTVLFGKSGLGKTSILQAGLVPGLRARGYFPVYLRIDYGHDSPEASEQIKQAINRAAVRAGEREESAGAAGEEAAAQGTTAEATAAEEGAAQGAGQGPAAEGAAQGSNGQVAGGQGAVGRGRLGHGAAAPAIDPEESIWEFLHHREGAQDSGAVPGDVSAATRTVKSPAAPPAPAAPLGATASTVPLGATAPPIATAPPRPTAPPTSTPAITPIPLLIFDQFEELFTLAQSDEFGRARAARFVEELADLVENRPPQALEARLDSDDGLSERFDFARSDYRVVISLREDYLAPLESLKKQMPSLSQNRLRLAPMTGAQALEAVLLPGQRPRAGRPLVTEEVAEAIVRFVAGGAELANAEVEPSLLSLICRELNEQRLAQHHSEISLGLLAGSRESILGSFYERALADQPPAVRSLIEDELLTESGYRENLAEESLLRKLQTAGAAPDALAKLVNRRLLRIEERLDVRRVELTHDVLTGVVKTSRDQRHEREAREATERLLAGQVARGNAARRALRRARAIAAGCTLLALVAIAAAVAAFFSVQRARQAEQVARQTRATSEQARQQAEGLLGFLTDSFVRELETFGREQTIAELSQREIDYFQRLPPQLKDTETVRSGALALVNHANALAQLGDLDTAARDATEATALLEQLRRADPSDATAVALGRAYTALGSLAVLQNGSAAYSASARAIALLRPIAGRPGSPVEARRAYVEALNLVGWLSTSTTQKALNEEAAGDEREAMRLATQLGARRGGDATLDADYAGAAGWLTNALVNLGRDEEALRAGEDALALVDQVLAQRPQYGDALDAKVVLQIVAGEAAANELDPSLALGFALQGVRTCLIVSGLEPRNAYYLANLGFAYAPAGTWLWVAGRLHQSLAYERKAMEMFGQAGGPLGGGAYFIAGVSDSMATAAYEQALLGDPAGVAAILAGADTLTSASTLRRLGLTGSYTELFIHDLRSYPAAALAYERGDFAAARRMARSTIAPLLSRRAQGPLEISLRDDAVYRLSDLEGHAEYALGAFAAAAQAERAALEAYQDAATYNVMLRTPAQISTWLSMALARAGKRDEAARTIAPVVQMYRALEKKNHGDRWLPLELAEALYAQSLTGDAHRAQLLREAAQRIDHLVPTIAALHDTREWRARIREALRQTAGK